MTVLARTVGRAGREVVVVVVVVVIQVFVELFVVLEVLLVLGVLVEREFVLVRTAVVGVSLLGTSPLII